MASNSNFLPDDRLAQIIEDAIPKSLADVNRLPRDLASLTLVNEKSLMDLNREIQYRDVYKTMNQWRFIRFTMLGRTEINLLGLNERGVLRITSAVRGIDLNRWLVTTNSGTQYMLGIPGEGEPPKDMLIGLCVFLHGFGYGKMLGVPRWRYTSMGYVLDGG